MAGRGRWPEVHKTQKLRLLREVKMRIMKLAGVALLLISAPALGQTLVAFELEMGGDNQDARCPEDVGGSYDFFLLGDTANGQQLSLGQPVTWGVRVSASGDYEVPGSPGTYVGTPGVANFVFNLELHQGTAAGPLVTTATFESSTQNGVGGCDAASAAFAYTMDANGWGPARAIDPFYGGPYGGVRMDVNTYPTNPGDGTLLGMGAGYSRWVRSGGFPEYSIAGVGRTEVPCDPTYGCVGVGPVCEGQISGLGLGTYTLVVTAGAGVNVLRSGGVQDVDLSVSQNSFAIAADSTQDDEITFEIVDLPDCDAVVTSVATVKTHANGPWAITDNAAPWLVTESRTTFDEPPLQIVITFSSDVGSLQGAVGGGGLTVDNQTLSGDGLTLTLDVSGAANFNSYTIDLSAALPDCPAGSEVIVVRQCEGNTNSDNTTNNTDKSQVAAANGVLADGNTAFMDVNLDGIVSNTDKAATAALNGSSCP